MTAEEWDSWMDISAMLKAITPTKRKERLFIAGCCRQVWDRLEGEGKEAVVAAELYADGNISAAALRRNDSLAWDEYMDKSGTDTPWLSQARFMTGYVASQSASCLHRILMDNEVDRGFRAFKDNDWSLFRQVLREIIGNPFRQLVSGYPAWQTPTVMQVAQETYDTRDWASLPVLADALEDSGCNSEEVLSHLRGTGRHFLGCWALDLILGKE